MENTALTLSQLLMTRFCHDITGPVGAVNNGVEFLEEGAGMDAQAMELIAGSATEALARIQFYRYAYGILKESGPVDVQEKKELIEAFYAPSKVQVTWNDVASGLDTKDCQILFNLLLIIAATLLRGGEATITVHHEAEHIDAVVITGVGELVKLDEQIQQTLTAKDLPQPDTKTVQAYYTRRLIEQLQGTLNLTMQEDSCSATYHPALIQGAHE